MQMDLKRSIRRDGPSFSRVLNVLSKMENWVCFDDAQGRQVLSFTDASLIASNETYLDTVRAQLQCSRVEGHPFSGGVMGFVSYEAGRFSECMPTPKASRLHPDIGLRRYEGSLVLDKGEWWIAGSPIFCASAEALLQRAEEAPDVDVQAAHGRLMSPPSPEEYIQAVQVALAHIEQGDCYQVNVARRLSLEAPASWVSAYLHLRSLHPAAFGAILHSQGDWVISNSPELFLRVQGERVQTSPIKGTRPRYGALSSSCARDELVESCKERAELTMIVDMARNDLSRVCLPGSVSASEREILELPTLFHAQQTVTGILSSDRDAVDAFAASFPPASVTGAPKVKAMELIDGLEPVGRGVYTGAIGFFADGGDACFSVAIRTVAASGNRAHLHVGSGIVADSDPYQELAESGWKAQALLLALTGERRLETSQVQGKRP